MRDDHVVLDAEAALLAGATEHDVLDRWIFAGNRPVVREVHVAGQTRVHDGRHPLHDVAARDYAAAMHRLLAVS